MTLYEKITEDIKTAMKAGDSLRVEVLRMVVAAARNQQIENRKKEDKDELSEDDMIAVLTREAKKRKDAVDAFTRGGRSEMAEKEQKEHGIIQEYLPESMGEEEVRRVVDAAILKIGASEPSDMGRVMGEVMRELKGKADGGMVKNVAQRALEDSSLV